MKILITGGAGFIGSNIVDGYVADGHQVVVVDDLSTGKKEFLPPSVVFHQASISDKDAMMTIISSEKPDIINHHAAQISVRHSVEDPGFDAQLNIVGMLNILEAGKRSGVKKFIFASSGGAIYGDASVIPTSETYHPVIPLSPYGVAKLSGEYYLQYYHAMYKIPYVALRYSNVYGPRQNPHGEAGVVAIFCQKMIKGESPLINGDGKQTRDYVFVGDIVRANVAAITTSFVGPCNIGTGVETDVVSIFQQVRAHIGASTEENHGPAKLGEQLRSCLDITKASDVLGWRPQMPLSGGLKETVSYFQSHG